MANSPTVGIDIVARLDRFKAELASIPDIGGKEAKKLTAQLSREIKAAEKASREAAKAAKDAKTGFTSLDSSFGKTGQSAAKLAGALGLLSPQAAEAARGIADLADVGEVAATVGESLGIGVGGLGAGLAVLTTAVGAAWLAWEVYTDENERAAVIAADVRAAHEQLIPILEDTRSATIDLKQATGELSDLQADLERNSLRAHRALMQATSESTKLVGDLRAEQGGVLTQLVDIGESIMPAWTPYGAVLRATTSSSADLQQRIDALNGTIEDAQQVTRDNVETHEQAIRAKDRHKRTTDALKDSEKDLAAAQRESQDAMRDMAAFMEDFERDSAAATESTRRLVEEVDALGDSETERARRAGRRREEEITQQIAANEALGLATTDLDAALVENARKTQEEITRIHEEENTRRQESMTKSWAATTGAVSSLFATASDAMVENNKEGALAMFQASRVAALAEAAINAALAVSEASALPPPANIPAMVAATAIGAANIAAVAAVPPPSFGDTPGPMKMQRGGQVQFAGGDFFAAAQTPEDLRRQVVGENAWAANPERSIRVGHRGFDYYVRDHLKKNGALAKAFRGSKRTGHRER